MAKKSQKCNLTYFVLSKFTQKVCWKKSNLQLPRIWGNIFVHIQANYQKDRIKTEEACLNKIWQTD